MAEETNWTHSLPDDIRHVLATYDATEQVDILAVLKREKILRRAVYNLGWEDIVAAGIGIRNNSFGSEPEIAIDLMERPEAGLLFVGGFFTDLGVPNILRDPKLGQMEEFKRRIDVTRRLVDSINEGKVTETSWEFVDSGWLLARAKDRLAECGPEWALDPNIVDPVIKTAQQKLDARLHDKSFEQAERQTAQLLDLAEHKEKKVRNTSGPVGSPVERLMRTLVSKRLF